jgi:hypothetical protein
VRPSLALIQRATFGMTQAELAVRAGCVLTIIKRVETEYSHLLGKLLPNRYNHAAIVALPFRSREGMITSTGE